jgi:hypothetical protein
MNETSDSNGYEPPGDQEYQTLVLLDELESLLEDLEEQGITGLEGRSNIPEDLQQRMAESGVHDVQQLRDKLMRLHAQVDEDERDLTISDS